MPEARVRTFSGRTAPTTDALLRQMTDERWQTFTRQLARVRRRGSEAAVHDVRVATRRLLAVLDLVSAVLATKTAGRIRKAARVLLKTLNALRDVQVQRGMVARSSRVHPVLRPYGVFLRRREAVLSREAAEALRKFPLARIEQQMDVLETELRQAFDRTPVRSAGLHLLAGMAAARYARVVQYRRAIRFDRPDSLHRLRVAFKKYRYTIEILAPVFGWVTPELHKAMGRYQTGLGEIQDLEVLSSNLRAFARTWRPGRLGRPVSFLPVYRLLESRREELMAQFRRSVNDVYRFWNPLQRAE